MYPWKLCSCNKFRNKNRMKNLLVFSGNRQHSQVDIPEYDMLFQIQTSRKNRGRDHVFFFHLLYSAKNWRCVKNYKSSYEGHLAWMAWQLISEFCVLAGCFLVSNKYLRGQIFNALLAMKHMNECLFRCTLLLAASSLTCLDRFLKASGNNTLPLAKENWVRYHGQNYSGRKCSISNI